MAGAASGRCKLCLGEGATPAGRHKHREFLHCPSCGLIFVPERDWVRPDEERARYAHHDNSESNTGYVRFLGEVADVAASAASAAGAGARVLDFGSGENAVLARLLGRRGIDATAYDPLYGLGATALASRYDVVVLCEVIEHLRDLRAELIRLVGCLNQNGRVVVRTQCYPSVAEITSWWYARDLTHINFFAPQTLAFAAALCGLRVEATAHPDIVIWTSVAGGPDG
jgi:hypothetical protein